MSASKGNFMKDMSDVLLITVRNDAESCLIHLIALRAGIRVFPSAQPHGATLDRETGILDLVRAVDRKYVWTVEIPGVNMETVLRANKFHLMIIDHHMYRGLDRAHDAFGKRLQSSLEQFLALAEITDTDLVQWGFDPVLVRGIGIMDDRYLQGLKKSKYTPEQIKYVLRHLEELEQQVDAHYDERLEAAQRAFRNRIMSPSGFIGYFSENNLSVSRMVSMLASQHDDGQKPSVIYSRGGKQILIVNVKPEQIQTLNQRYPNRHTWTYGAGRCWGIDNEKSPENLWVRDSFHTIVMQLTQP